LNARSWPEGSDPVDTLLRRALDDAALRGPDDMMLRRGWTAVASPKRPLRARRWSWFAGGVATTAALAAVCALWLWPRAVAKFSQARLSQSTFRTRVAGPGALGSSPAALGTRRLTLEGGVEAQLGSSSVMRLEDDVPRVEKGEVGFSVPHRPPGHPFVVRADAYNVVVVGTRFRVAVDGPAVGVDVDEGVVEVRQASTQRRLARLTPGEAWRSAVPVVETGAGPAPAVSPAPVGVPPKFAARASERVYISASADGRHPSARPAPRLLALAAPGQGILRGGQNPAATPGLAGTGDDSATAARSALAVGDAPRALQIYRALALRTGPAAENAAYEVGKVLNERLGQPTNAVAAWRRYRAEYPDGILRVEADVSIVETLARTGEPDEALSEANDFLRRHPDSERRAEIARLAGDIYRARGDCRRAIGAYQIVLGAPRPRDVVEVATFHRAACLVRLGDPAGGEAARAYLHTYPNGRFRSEAAALVGDGARSLDGRARTP
jgi:hypothetical protein